MDCVWLLRQFLAYREPRASLTRKHQRGKTQFMGCWPSWNALHVINWRHNESISHQREEKVKITKKVRALGASLADRAKVRKQLRGPARLSYALADSITMLDAAAWKSVTAHAGFFLSFDYLAGLERVLPSNMSPRYALIFDERDGQRELVAAVCMQI